MTAARRQDPVVAGHRLPHACLVEHPRTERGPQAGHDVPVRERGHSEPVLRREEFRQPGSGQMVQQPAGDDDRAGAVRHRHAGLERIAANEPAVQLLQAGQAARLGHEHRVQVNPDEFGIRAQRSGGGQRPDDVSEAAADIDHPDRTAVAAEPAGERPQQRRHPAGELQFLRQALQLAVHPDTERVHVGAVEETAGRWHARHDPRRPALALAAEPGQHLSPGDRQPLTVRAGRPQQVGDLQRPGTHGASKAPRIRALLAGWVNGRWCCCTGSRARPRTGSRWLSGCRAG